MVNEVDAAPRRFDAETMKLPIVLATRVSRELASELQRAAAEEDRTRGAFIRLALREVLARRGRESDHRERANEVGCGR